VDISEGVIDLSSRMIFAGAGEVKRHCQMSGYVCEFGGSAQHLRGKNANAPQGKTLRRIGKYVRRQKLWRSAACGMQERPAVFNWPVEGPG